MKPTNENMRKDIQILEDLIPLQCAGHKETVNYKEAMEKQWVMCLNCNAFICQDCVSDVKNEMNGQCPNGFFGERQGHLLREFPIAPKAIIKMIEQGCEQRKQQLTPLVQVVEETHDNLDYHWSEINHLKQVVKELIEALQWVQEFFRRNPLELLERQATILKLQLEQQQAKTAMKYFQSVKELQQRLLEIEDHIVTVKTNLPLKDQLNNPTSQQQLAAHLRTLKIVEKELNDEKDSLTTLFLNLKQIKKELKGKEEEEYQELMNSVTIFLQSVLKSTLRNARISSQRIEPFIKLYKAIATFLPQLLVGGANIERYRKEVENTIGNVQTQLNQTEKLIQRCRTTMMQIIEQLREKNMLEDVVVTQLTRKLNTSPKSTSQKKSIKKAKKTMLMVKNTKKSPSTNTPKQEITIKKDLGKVKILENVDV